MFGCIEYILRNYNLFGRYYQFENNKGDEYERV